MYCGKCGKQMPNQAEFCPDCGAPNPNAAGKAAAVGPSQAKAAAGGKGSIFRIILVVLGALHVLAFFGLSYAELSGLGVLMSYALPGELTAMSYITFSLDAASSGLLETGTLIVNVVSCLLPLLLGLGVILSNVRRKGYIKSLILGVCLLLAYLFLGVIFSSMESTGYAATAGGALGCLMAVLTIMISIAGRLVDSRK